MATENPIPPKTRLHDKLEHLTLAEQRRVLAILNQLAPKHNLEVAKHRWQAGDEVLPAQPLPWKEMLDANPGLGQEWQSQDWASKLKIEYLVTQYLNANPSYVYPTSGDIHPSVLAIGTQMQGWLMDALGGAKEYWVAMFSAAQVWFADLESEPHLAREFRIFCTFFDMPGCFGYEGDSEYKALYKEYDAWRRRRSKFRNMYDPNDALDTGDFNVPGLLGG